MYWRVRATRPLYGNPYGEPLHARDAVADGEAHERRQVADAELERNAAAVGVDAARGNAQLRRDLFARSAGDHPLEHLPIAPARSLISIAPGELSKIVRRISSSAFASIATRAICTAMSMSCRCSSAGRRGSS